MSAHTDKSTTPDAASLDAAPKHIQLAVDLIMLLETNNIDNETALAAVEIVKQDLINKQSQR